VIAGQRADEPVRKLSPEDGLEPIPRTRARLREPGQSGTVIEEAADGSSVGTRRLVHGPFFIDASHPRSDPWRE
jgi:hypothetical protein